MILRCFFVMFLLFVGCGKVAQDISSQSSKSIFKEARILFDFSIDELNDWSQLVSSKDVTSVYSYYQGLKLDQGFEKIGWVQADVKMQIIASKNVPYVSNYDLKKNIVTTSRYQQGFISLQKVSTKNFQVLTQFRKVRPKFDYYSFVQYMSKDTYAFLVTESVSTASVKITPHKHLVSLLYLNHLKKESYNRDTIIPLATFYSIIPTAAVSPTLNVMPKNTVKTFHTYRPIFSIKSPLYDALLATITLAYYSDKFDALEYVKNEDLFSKLMKTQLSAGIHAYFESKKVEDVSPTLNITPDDQ